MASIPLAGGPEFDRIRDITRRLGARAGLLGDDCALLKVGGRILALSTDVSVEGVHFRREWLAPEEIGWRATAAALSDLAAMGASAIGVLVALTVPSEAPPELTGKLMDGVGAAAASVGGKVLGGDLSRGEAVALAVTVVGEAARPVERRGALPGQRVWVSGVLGGARSALAAWKQGREPAAGARTRFARPEPRIALGQRLAALGASAMIDLSDGLGADAAHLAAASGVALRIRLEALPVDGSVSDAAAETGEAVEVFAARGGEDYELLVVLPAGVSPDPGLGLREIGEVTPGEGVVLLRQGTPVSIPGYDHFA